MLKRIFDIVGPYQQTLVVGLIFKVLEAIFTNLGFLVVYLVLVQLISGQVDSGQIWLWLGVLLLAYFFQAVCYQGNTVMNQKIFLRLKKEWRIGLMEHLRRQPLGFYSRKQTGDLGTILTKDVEQVEMLPELFFTELVKNLALPIVSAIIFYTINWRMATAVVIGAILTIPVFYFSRKITRRITDSLARSNGQVAARAVEYTQGMAVLKSFNVTGENFSSLEKSLAEHRQASIDQIIKLIPSAVVSFFFLRIGSTLVLLTGAFLFLGGQLSLPVLILFLLLSLRFYAPLIQLIDFAYTMGKTASALERVYSVLEAQPLPEPVEERRLQNFDIEFKEVHFSYEDKPVLQGVSFHVPEKSITALVGPSGSGKTTITNLIARFWDVDGGEVRVGGHNIKDLKTDYLLSQISIVFQNVYLFNDTIENNIKIGKPEATHAEVIEAAQAARCHEFIEKLSEGYNTMVGEGGATLSGGEKQRISIARAILKDAPIVLLDEATASIDPENEHLIQEAFNALTAHKTLIIIAHRLNTIAHADQILVLEDGKLVERGQHNELIRQDGLYRRFWLERQKARSWKMAAKPGSVSSTGQPITG
jgi:ATP-binding cassette subfamily B protein